MPPLPTTSTPARAARPARAAARPGGGPAARPAAPGNTLGFFLFLLVNTALFVRPADVIPALIGVEIYQYLILTCFAVSFPAVLASLSPARLEKRPIDVCVLLLLPAAVLSLFTRGNAQELWDTSFSVFKIIVYYLLLVSLVTTPRRLRIFIACLVICAAGVTVLSALDFYKVIQLPRVAGTRTGSMDLNRMYGPGIFQDPNDICVLIVTALVLVLGCLSDRRAGPGRLLWLAVLPIFAFGFYLTQSRGGLLALLAGLGMLIRLRFGWPRAILLGAIAFPVLLAFLGARQTAISTSTETGMLRMWLWNDGLVMVRANPVFGVGWGHYAEEAGQVAHNSYMHALAETGLFGGALFLGASFLALWGLYRLVRPARGPRNEPIPCRIEGPELAQLYPFLTGAVTAYLTGMLTLSLNDMATTYSMLGMACIFQGMATTQPARPPLRCDVLMPVRFLGLCIVFLAGMFVFIRLFMRV